VVDAEEVTFEMTASNKPAVIRSGNDFLYVIMPVDLG
jgi:DNA polymerase III sliding clamp (beta) subunit (PCNA family)